MIGVHSLMRCVRSPPTICAWNKSNCIRKLGCETRRMMRSAFTGSDNQLPGLERRFTASISATTPSHIYVHRRTLKVDKDGVIALNGSPLQSYRASPAVWDHTVLPATQRSTCLYPSQICQYSIYLPRRDGRLSWSKR